MILSNEEMASLEMSNEGVEWLVGCHEYGDCIMAFCLFRYKGRVLPGLRVGDDEVDFS